MTAITSRSSSTAIYSQIQPENDPMEIEENEFGTQTINDIQVAIVYSNTMSKNKRSYSAIKINLQDIPPEAQDDTNNDNRNPRKESSHSKKPK